MIERRPCPACGAEDPDLIFEQRFARIAAGSLLAGYEVVCCKPCGCGYADRLPPQAAFDAYYRELSKYEYQDNQGRESSLDHARFGDIAGLIARFTADRASRVLEVGCATGGLLASLRALGLHQVSGLDPSPYCAAAAARLHGLEVKTGTLSDPPAGAQRFGMVVLVGVLEHIRDLTPALQRVRDLLEPRGRIYVEVPDATRFSEFLDAPFQQFSVEHVIFFSAASLDRLLRRHGFAAVHVERTARPDTAYSTMPVIAAVYQRTAAAFPPLPRDSASAPGLRDYVSASAAMDRGIRAAIDQLADSGEAVLVWGVGTHTARLLETSRLREVNIRAFVDSNAKYHGKDLAGIPILPPETLWQRSEPVLISSRVFQAEIAGQIRDRLRCPNRLIFLYPS